VPVAGWDEKSPKAISTLGQHAKEQLTEEYAQSFSLSPFTTAVNADIILRIAKEAHKMEVFENRSGKRFLTVSAGVRITDAEEFLAHRKLALRPHMTTLHVASLVGAASNGCYGPAKDYTSMTSDIIKMKVITPLGKNITLSAKQNPQLFASLRDCHMGAGFFVREMTLKNIEPDFLMKRTDLLLQDASELATAMHKRDLINKPHLIVHFFPVDMDKTGSLHTPRFRVSTFERTIEAPTVTTQAESHQDIVDSVNLVETSAGEPLINLIVNSKRLRPFFALVLKAAALKTFGHEKEKVDIGPSARTIHLLRTYTASPIVDVNWLIQVANTDEGRDLLLQLMLMVETQLAAAAKNHEHPLLTVYARFIKGLHLPENTGGVAPTAVDSEGQYILSFEFLSYTQLADTNAFKNIQSSVIAYLNEHKYKFKYHPGKSWPSDINSLTQIFNDSLDKKRLANFQKAIIDLHGGEANIPFSPLLTPQKKIFIGLTTADDLSAIPQPPQPVRHTLTLSQRQQALTKIIELAKELQQDAIATHAKSMLKD
jgi:hypothetical protein